MWSMTTDFSLHASGKSAFLTQAVYTLALTYLDGFLAEGGMPRASVRAPAQSTSRRGWPDVRDQGRSPATVSVYYRSLQPFWPLGQWRKDYPGFFRP